MRIKELNLIKNILINNQRKVSMNQLAEETSLYMLIEQYL